MDGIKALLDDTVVVVSGEGHGATAGARGANGDKAGAEKSEVPFPSLPLWSNPLPLPFRILGLFVLGLEAECGLCCCHF